MNTIRLAIEKLESFDVPEGFHRVALKAMFDREELDVDPESTMIRFKWRLIEPQSPFTEFVVAKNYARTLGPHSELRRDLIAWFGEDRLKEFTSDGSLLAEKLVDQMADVEILHKPNKGHRKPFVHIAKIGPPGSMVPAAPNAKPATTVIKRKR